jgi:hypothetical protein
MSGQGLRPTSPARNGLLSLDADISIPKRRRADVLASAVIKHPEKNPGLGNYRAKNLADPANPLFWENHPGTGGTNLPRGGASSWSFALACYHLGANTFQPLEWGNGNPNQLVGAAPVPPNAAGRVHAGIGYRVGIGGHTGQFGVTLPVGGGGVPPAAPGPGPSPQPVPAVERHGPSDRANLDNDFGSHNVHVAHYGKTLPEGVIAAMIATTHHGQKDIIGILSGGPLVADWRGPQANDMSRYMMDIELLNGANPVPARKRRAGLHTAFEVRSFEPPCAKYAAPSTNKYAIALNAKTAADGTGNLLATFGPADGYLANARSGPLIESLPWHTLASTRDGALRSGSIATTAYFRYMKQVLPSGSLLVQNDLRLKTQAEIDTFGLDGPIEFVPDCWIPPQRGPNPWATEIRWDHRGSKHAFYCDPQLGVWRLETWLPQFLTPGCEPTRQALVADVDANNNPRRNAGRQAIGFSQGMPLISNGIRFQARAGVLYGRPTMRLPRHTHTLGSEAPPRPRSNEDGSAA